MTGIATSYIFVHYDLWSCKWNLVKWHWWSRFFFFFKWSKAGTHTFKINVCGSDSRTHLKNEKKRCQLQLVKITEQAASLSVAVSSVSILILTKLVSASAVKIYIRVKAKAVVPCYGQFICVWQPAAKATRLLAQLTMWQRALLVTMLSNSGSRFYSLYSYLYYIGVPYIEVLLRLVTGEKCSWSCTQRSSTQTFSIAK